MFKKKKKKANYRGGIGIAWLCYSLRTLRILPIPFEGAGAKKTTDGLSGPPWKTLPFLTDYCQGSGRRCWVHDFPSWI